MLAPNWRFLGTEGGWGFTISLTFFLSPRKKNTKGLLPTSFPRLFTNPHKYGGISSLQAKPATHEKQRLPLVLCSCMGKALRHYSQHRQHYLNHSFWPQIGTYLPTQFPESPPVGTWDVGNSALLYTSKTRNAEMTSNNSREALCR